MTVDTQNTRGKVSKMNTTITPATVRELADLAAAQGKTPSEFLAELMAATPPAGFVQQPDALQPDIMSDYYDGPTFKGEGWSITTHWAADGGLSFYVDELNGNAIPAAEAPKITAALAEVARLAA